MNQNSRQGGDRRQGQRRQEIQDRRVVADEKFVFRQGEPGDTAYIVMSGTIEIVMENSGDEIVINRLHEGSMFGEMALIDDQPRLAAARAVGGPAELLVITRTTFSQRLDGLDAFSRGLIRILSSHVRGLTAELSEKRVGAS